MGIYRKFILPRLLDSAMGSAEIEKLRPGVLSAASGVVLEIGAGAGHNLPFYKNISKLYALEPSKELTKIAAERAGALGFPVEFLDAKAENIPLPDGSVDTVVSTWTLCSIGDPEEALKKIRRVLRPDGRFIFIDHGISPKPLVRTLQKSMTPFTKYFTGNCHMDRDIKKLICDAGFSIKKLDQFAEKSKPLMYNSRGVAKIGL
jgi:ubiquinone/menaquinone biosynthesis C-methylase UbiE